MVRPTPWVQHGSVTKCARRAMAWFASSGGCPKPTALSKTPGATRIHAHITSDKSCGDTHPGPQADSAKRSNAMMGQIPEGLQNETANALFGTAESATDGYSLNAVICVYGHGPTKNPFYEEARTVRVSPAGALLILGTSVSRGQRLLLLNGAGQTAVEAQIVRTRTLGAQMLEVEVAF